MPTELHVFEDLCMNCVYFSVMAEKGVLITESNVTVDIIVRLYQVYNVVL